DTSNWVQHVTSEVPEPLYSFVTELAVTPLPASSEEEVMRYSRDIMNRLLEMQITEQKADLIGRLQRWDAQQDPKVFRPSSSDSSSWKTNGVSCVLSTNK